MGIHKRRRADVIGWIEQGIEEGSVAPTIDVELIADHFTASVSGIVYHWMSDPDNLDEMRSLHNGLKQVMAAMLAFRLNKLVKSLKVDKDTSILRPNSLPIANTACMAGTAQLILVVNKTIIN